MRISDWSSDVCSSDLVRPECSCGLRDVKGLERGVRIQPLQPALNAENRLLVGRERHKRIESAMLVYSQASTVEPQCHFCRSLRLALPDRYAPDRKSVE